MEFLSTMLSISYTNWSVIHSIAFKVHIPKIIQEKVWSFSTFAYQI